MHTVIQGAWDLEDLSEARPASRVSNEREGINAAYSSLIEAS